MSVINMLLTLKVRDAFIAALFLTSWPVLAVDVVWSCSRSEPEPEKFDRLRPYRIENLTAKDLGGISITLSDLYAAYGGNTVQMGSQVLAVCTLPNSDPLQIEAMDVLGYTLKDLEAARNSSRSKMVLIDSVHRMQKCIVENHPAVGFMNNVVENERVGPCF